MTSVPARNRRTVLLQFLYSGQTTSPSPWSFRPGQNSPSKKSWLPTPFSPIPKYGCSPGSSRRQTRLPSHVRPHTFRCRYPTGSRFELVEIIHVHISVSGFPLQVSRGVNGPGKGNEAFQFPTLQIGLQGITGGKQLEECLAVPGAETVFQQNLIILHGQRPRK